MTDFEMLKEFLKPIQDNIEKLYRAIEEIRDELKTYLRDVDGTKECLFKLTESYNAYKTIHDNEHNQMWKEIRDIRDKPKNDKQGLKLWLDIVLKIVAVSAIFVTAVLTLKKAGIL